MRILIASQLEASAISRLQQEHDVLCAFDCKRDQLLSLIGDREALIFRSGVVVDTELLDRAPRLQLIVRAGCGLDNLDLDYVRQHQIRLERISQPAAIAVAELTFGVMLGVARRVLEADTLLRQGRWAKKQMMGHLLYGKVLGIVGAGNIGSRVGEFGAAIGMSPMGCVESPGPAARTRLRAKGILLAGLEEVLAKADFVSVHVPLKDSTRNLIDAHALALMKPDSFLVNMARGGVVDEAALFQALVSGRIKGAALDVHQNEGEGKISPLASLPNVILTPHIGSNTFETQTDIGRRVVQIVNTFHAAPLSRAAAAD